MVLWIPGNIISCTCKADSTQCILPGRPNTYDSSHTRTASKCIIWVVQVSQQQCQGHTGLSLVWYSMPCAPTFGRP